MGVFVFDSGTGAVLGKVPIPPPQKGYWAFGDALVLADGSLGFVSFEREIFVLELQASPPRIAGRIPISSGGFELSFTPDQSALVASGPPNEPFVSVIDIARREETHVFDVGMAGGSHDTCADGTVPYSAGYGSHLGRLTLASDRTLPLAARRSSAGTPCTSAPRASCSCSL